MPSTSSSTSSVSSLTDTSFIKELVPVGDVTTGWGTSTGASHYTEIDEGSTPAAGDYIQTTALNQTDQFTLTDSATAGITGPVWQVEVFLYTVALGGASTVTVSWYTDDGSTLNASDTISIDGTTKWRSVKFNQDTHPALTWPVVVADIDTSEIRIKNTAGSASAIVYSIYVNVEFSAGSSSSTSSTSSTSTSSTSTSSTSTSSTSTSSSSSTSSTSTSSSSTQSSTDYCWEAAIVRDTNSPGLYASLAYINGQPAIAHYESDFDQLQYSSFDGSSWTTSYAATGGNVGQFASLASIDGQPAISYYYGTGQDLRYARWNGSSWVRRTVDSTGVVGQYTSLADINGQPGISYYDGSNTSLKYARYNGSSWDIETVDNAAAVGVMTSIALVNGQPAISYYDNSNTSLKYARYNGSTWDIETVDTGGDIGQYSSLAVINGQPAISYFDDSNDDLKYARWNGSSWDIETVDSTGIVGQFSSLASVDGQPAISYYDNTNGNLKYARWNGSSWVVHLVDGIAADVGWYTSIAVIGSNAGIAYRDATNSDLKYAEYRYCESSSSSSETSLTSSTSSSSTTVTSSTSSTSSSSTSSTSSSSTTPTSSTSSTSSSSTTPTTSTSSSSTTATSSSTSSSSPTTPTSPTSSTSSSSSSKSTAGSTETSSSSSETSSTSSSSTTPTSSTSSSTSSTSSPTTPTSSTSTTSTSSTSSSSISGSTSSTSSTSSSSSSTTPTSLSSSTSTSSTSPTSLTSSSSTTPTSSTSTSSSSTTPTSSTSTTATTETPSTTSSMSSASSRSDEPLLYICKTLIDPEEFGAFCDCPDDEELITFSITPGGVLKVLPESYDGELNVYFDISIYADAGRQSLVSSVSSLTSQKRWYVQDTVTDTITSMPPHGLNLTDSSAVYRIIYQPEVLPAALIETQTDYELTSYGRLERSIPCGVTYYIVLRAYMDGGFVDLDSSTYHPTCEDPKKDFWRRDDDAENWICSGQGKDDLKVNTTSDQSLFPSVSANRYGNFFISWQDHRVSNDMGGRHLPSVYYATWSSDEDLLWSSGQGFYDRQFLSNGYRPVVINDAFENPFVAAIHSNRSEIAISKCDVSVAADDTTTDAIALLSVGETTFNARVYEPDIKGTVAVGPTEVIPVVEECFVRLDVEGVPGAYRVRLRNENDREWTDWITISKSAASPTVGTFSTYSEGYFIDDSERFIMPWVLSAGNGVKRVCMQILTFADITDTVCIDIYANISEFSHSVTVYSDSGMTTEVGKFERMPVLSITDGSSATYYVKVEFNDVERLEKAKEIGGTASLTFDVIQQGTNDQYGLSLTEDTDNAGLYTGSFVIERNDGVYNKDGSAAIVVNVPDFCHPETSGVTCGSDASDILNRMDLSKFGVHRELFSDATPAEVLQAQTDDSQTQVIDTDTFKGMYSVDDPRFAFGRPNIYRDR